MTDLLREAEEEIRRETIEGTAKKAAPFFIGAIILALVAGGAFQLWRNNQDKAREQASLDYYAAMGLETTEVQLMDTIFPHPTLSEMMHEAVLDAYGRAVHI